MKNKLQILALASWYPNENDVQLGIFVKHQLQAIAKDHDVVLVTLRPASFPGKEVHRDNGFEHRAHYYVRNQYPIKFMSWYVAWMSIINQLEKKRFDLLHLHVVYPMGFIATRIQQELRIPLLVSEHWSGYRNQNLGNWFQRRIARKTIQKSARIITQSNFLKSLMQKHFPDAPYSVVPNIVHLPMLMPGVVSSKEVIALHIGDHIDKTKNISSLLRAMKPNLEQFEDLKLIQVGSGPDEKRIKALARELGIENRVEFKGRLTQEEVVQLMLNCHFGIVSSHLETFSIVSFEFLAQAKPLVVTPCGGPDEYLPVEGVIRSDSSESEDLAKAIQKMVLSHNLMDLTSISRLIRNQFSEEEFRKKINAVYELTLSDA